MDELRRQETKNQINMWREVRIPEKAVLIKLCIAQLSAIWSGYNSISSNWAARSIDLTWYRCVARELIFFCINPKTVDSSTSRSFNTLYRRARDRKLAIDDAPRSNPNPRRLEQKRSIHHVILQKHKKVLLRKQEFFRLAPIVRESKVSIVLVISRSQKVPVGILSG